MWNSGENFDKKYYKIYFIKFKYILYILLWNIKRDTTIYNIKFYHETLGFIIMDYKIIL